MRSGPARRGKPGDSVPADHGTVNRGSRREKAYKPMRKEYGKALRDAFERAMKQRLPDYKPARLKSLYLGPGERPFCWNPGGTVHCFVILMPSPKEADEFTVELAWSVHGRFPELGMRPSGPATRERAEFRKDEFACRLGSLWATQDVWWRLSDSDPFEDALSLESLIARSKPLAPGEAEAAVQPRVNDAMDRLCALGIPYLAEFARLRTTPHP